MEQATRQTVLITDDQNDNLVLISLWLQNLGYSAVTAVNGEAAIEIAKIARPDLILMDIAMPIMDGLDATRVLRETPGLSDLPIIFLTAFDTKEFRQRAGEAGGDGYLTKPIDFDRLSNLIQILLPRVEPPAAEQPAPAEEAAPAGPISDSTGSLDPRFMLWRLFCAQNNISIETLPSNLSRELKKKWQQLKKQRRPLFKF